MCDFRLNMELKFLRLHSTLPLVAHARKITASTYYDINIVCFYAHGKEVGLSSVYLLKFVADAPKAHIKKKMHHLVKYTKKQSKTTNSMQSIVSPHESFILKLFYNLT